MVVTLFVVREFVLFYLWVGKKKEKTHRIPEMAYSCVQFTHYPIMYYDMNTMGPPL